MIPLTATQRAFGLAICAFVFVLGVSVGLFVFREVLGLLCGVLLTNDIVSASAAHAASTVLLPITFILLCWANWMGCRKLWPYLFAQYYALKFRRTASPRED